jgi:hypothetical protein
MPAVPLPYIQKRKQQEAVLAKAKEQAATPIVVDVIEAPPSPTPLPTGDISPPSFNDMMRMSMNLRSLNPSMSPLYQPRLP